MRVHGFCGLHNSDVNREDAVTDCVPFLEVSIFPLLTISRPCGLWASMRYPVSAGHRSVSSRQTDGVSSSRFGATVFFFNWRLDVSLDSQYYIVVQALELRANLSCVYRELVRRARPGTLQLEQIILATVLRSS